MHRLITIATIRHPATWVLLYLLTHFSIQIGLNQTLQLDDAEQVRHAQHLALGYPIPQPPLYSWLTWALFQLIGTGLLALTLLKYTLIGCTFWLLWLVTEYLFKHHQTRWIATFSLLLMPSFAWHMHQGFTHTILLGMAIMMTLHATLRLPEHHSHTDYLYLGSAIGVGLMAKYSFLLFLILLFASALSIHTYHRHLIHPYIWITLVTIAAWETPHLYWLSEHHQQIFNSIDQKLKVSDESILLTRLSSLGWFITAAIAFVTPWLLLFIPLSIRQLFSPRTATTSPSTALLTRFYWGLLITVLSLSLFFSMPHFKVRWFHPLMMLFPLWLLAYIEEERPLSVTILFWVKRVTITITLLIIILRILQTTVGPDLGYYSRVNRPIIEALNQLPALEKSTLIKTKDPFLGAHLLAHYPHHTVQIGNSRYPRNLNSPLSQCLLLWDNDAPFSKPNLSDALITKQQIKTIGEVQYTLYTALFLKRCP